MMIGIFETINAQLKENLNGDALNNRAKYWIIYTLIKRDQDVRGFIDNIEGIKIKLPDFIDQDLRERF